MEVALFRQPCSSSIDPACLVPKVLANLTCCVLIQSHRHKNAMFKKFKIQNKFIVSEIQGKTKNILIVQIDSHLNPDNWTLKQTLAYAAPDSLNKIVFNCAAME